MPFNVRTPANYDPTIAYPLLLVYAAAGNNRYETEGLTGLHHRGHALVGGVQPL